MKRIVCPALLVSALFAFALPVRAETIAGLESYGDLTLVDSIDCATDAAHEFHQYPDNASSVTTILGESCRTMPHIEGSASYFSYRLGAGKGLVAGDMYLLVVEYPDDVPRTMTLLNRAMDSRNGFHTGRSIGDTLNAHIIPQTHCESWDVPLAAEYKRIEQLMVLNENVYPHDSTDGKKFLKSATDGFDVIFQLFQKEDAPDSAGAAIRSIRLYHVNNESALSATINYPRDAPRRYVTIREEMADDTGRSFNADWHDWMRNNVRLMKTLGINCYSRDILEFGYNQYWDITCGGKYSGWFNGTTDYYSDEVDICSDAGIFLMPYYEYAGSRGPSGLGYSEYRKCVPLFINSNGSTHFNKFVQASNGASGANVDITDSAANEDFRKILESTIIRYKDKANFVGAWIRNRGSIPMSFSDNTLARFNSDTKRTGGDAVTRQTFIEATGKTTEGDAYREIVNLCKVSDIYGEYREWWYGKRADFLSDMQKYLATNGIDNAKVFYSGCIDEAGLIGILGDWYNQYDDFVAANSENDWRALSGYSKTIKSIGWAAGDYQSNFLKRDEWTWWPLEYNHAAPMADPVTYQTRSNVAVAYPYNCIYTVVAPNEAPKYRNATGDLFFSRHYCLYEGCGSDLNGYFTCEMDRADRACMLPELYAVAYQDPTTIGFLQGNQLARNFTIPFREFSENFLSLPAVKGTVLQGGKWDAMLTIRKYVVGDDQYYAVINTSGSPVASAWYYITDDNSVTKLYETVSGTEHAVGSGYMRYELQPYQLLCFSTAKPGSTLWTVASSDVADRSAKVVATITSLKEDETGTLSGLVSASSDFSNAMTLDGKSVTAADEFTWTLSGLMPVTTYYVKLTYTPNEGSPVEKTLTFKTLTPTDWPSASELAIDSVGVTNLTAKATVENLGEGASEATVIFELAKSEDMAGAIERSVVLTSAGEAAVTFGALNSETEYYVRATVSNSLANVVTLDPVSATTKKISTATPFTGMYLPGLTQVKYGCEKSKFPDYAFDYTAADEKDLDRTLGTVMADVFDSGSDGKEYVNAWTGKSWKWANNTTYAYFGEMYMRAGVTYRFAGIIDDGEAMFVGDTKLFESSSWSSYGKESYTPSADGWYPIRIYVFDWDGGKGPSNNAANKWGKEMGFGWKTGGADSVEPASDWETLRDPGDGSLLRTRTSVPELIRVTDVSQAGKRVWTAVATELYDDDCKLEISVSKSADAKTVVKTIDPADRTAASVDIDTGYDVSGTASIYVAAHLVNARTGYDFWTEPFAFQPKDDTPRCEFGEIEAAVDLGGTNSTIRTTVEDIFGEAAKVELKVNGKTVNTWNDVQTADVLEFKADVARGSTNIYEFVFTSGAVTNTSDTGVFIATTYTDWFTVDFENDEAYKNGTDWAEVPDDRGSWSATGESELKGKEFVALAESEDAQTVVEYMPTEKSEFNADAKIWGRTKVTAGGKEEDLSSLDPCVGLTFVELVPHVYANGKWTTLAGGTPLVAGAPVDYALSFRFTDTSVPPQVLFTVGDWTSGWMSAADLPRRLSSVIFSGVGEFGSFRGAYYSLLPGGGEEPVEPVIKLVMPEFTTDGSAISLANAKFTMTVANPVEGAYYTVFTAERLTDPFTAAKDSEQYDPGHHGAVFPLTIDADRPSLFARIVISLQPFKAGDAL